MGRWEESVAELREVRGSSTPESKLGALIVAKGLKPTDILAK